MLGEKLFRFRNIFWSLFVNECHRESHVLWTKLLNIQFFPIKSPTNLKHNFMWSWCNKARVRSTKNNPYHFYNKSTWMVLRVNNFYPIFCRTFLPCHVFNQLYIHEQIDLIPFTFYVILKVSLAFFGVHIVINKLLNFFIAFFRCIIANNL